ncbi:MAG TPA: hypothetical protein PLV92_19220, partial [Pirellulaceae bacterium]|nr:hypothetical protein [Pirellulaceae bacterium]
MNATAVVMTFDDPTALDYASHLASRESRVVILAPAALIRHADQTVESWELSDEEDARLADRLRSRPVDSLVVFVGRARSNDRFDVLTRVLESLPTEGTIGVCLVSTFRVHFGDRRAAEVEAEMTRRVRAAGRRCSVLRPAFVLSPRSRPTAGLKRWSRWFPVLPAHWRAACVDGAELFNAIDRELTDRSRTPRIPATLLGANRSWREQVRRMADSGGRASVAANRSLVDACAAVFDPLWRITLFAVSRVAPGLRTLNFDTLRPQSRRELLELYNRHNYPHVRIVGYNNGVNHFGHQHPGRTIVSTCSAADAGDLRGDSAVFDAGATIADARQLLQAAGKQLPVLPNYSYVSLGTAFFVPIHGSSCTLTTLGDAIEKIVAYDPVADRIVRATRRDAEFAKWMYDAESRLLLLRLTISVSDRASYCVR